jgi:MFS family permease
MKLRVRYVVGTTAAYLIPAYWGALMLEQGAPWRHWIILGLVLGTIYVVACAHIARRLGPRWQESLISHVAASHALPVLILGLGAWSPEPIKCPQTHCIRAYEGLEFPLMVVGSALLLVGVSLLSVPVGRLARSRLGALDPEPEMALHFSGRRRA